MNKTDTKNHWEKVYKSNDASNVSWFQEHPELSLQFIKRTGIEISGQILDLGGGTSTLVDDLLEEGFQNVSVLDISLVALHAAQQRIGIRAQRVSWIEADVRNVELSARFYDVWHDRAVFHFLTAEEDRRRYVNTVQHAVKKGGHVIVATFDVDGPEKCSGLDVNRYDADSLHNEFGDRFELVRSVFESHQTPTGTEQKFVYCYCLKN